eukprot:gene8104-5640_t
MCLFISFFSFLLLLVNLLLELDVNFSISSSAGSTPVVGYIYKYIYVARKNKTKDPFGCFRLVCGVKWFNKLLRYYAGSVYIISALSLPNACSLERDLPSSRAVGFIMSNQSRTSSGVRSTKATGGVPSQASNAPPLALSARENSCTSALFLPAYGSMLHHAVLMLFKTRNFCAEKIQATFRMYRQRRAYLAIRRSVIGMQRVFRGHVTRVEMKQECAGQDEGFEMACFNYYATRIQAVFRGYYSRKYVDDYYARRAYIRTVAAHSEAVRQMAEQQRLANENHGCEDHREKMEAEYIKAAEQVHFMLSTVGKRGVYRRCVEDDIRKNAQRVRREERAKEVARIEAAAAARRKAEEERQHELLEKKKKKAAAAKKKQLRTAGLAVGEVTAGEGSTSNMAAGLHRSGHLGSSLLGSQLTEPGYPSGELLPGSASSNSSGGTATDDPQSARDPSKHRPPGSEDDEETFERMYMNEDLKLMDSLSGHNSPNERYGRDCGIAYSGEGERIGPHMISPSMARTCYWEEESALPQQRPLIPYDCCCRRRHPDNYKNHSTPSRPPPEGPVTQLQTWPTPSHFSLKYRGKGHDCLPPIPTVTQSTYNTEPAALAKSVDQQYVSKLHNNTIFKVGLYPPPRPPPPTQEDLQNFRETLELKRKAKKAAALAKLPKGPKPEELVHAHIYIYILTHDTDYEFFLHLISYISPIHIHSLDTHDATVRNRIEADDPFIPICFVRCCCCFVWVWVSLSSVESMQRQDNDDDKKKETTKDTDGRSRKEQKSLHEREEKKKLRDIKKVVLLFFFVVCLIVCFVSPLSQHEEKEREANPSLGTRKEKAVKHPGKRCCLLFSLVLPSFKTSNRAPTSIEKQEERTPTPKVEKKRRRAAMKRVKAGSERKRGSQGYPSETGLPPAPRKLDLNQKPRRLTEDGKEQDLDVLLFGGGNGSEQLNNFLISKGCPQPSLRHGAALAFMVNGIVRIIEGGVELDVPEEWESYVHQNQSDLLPYVYELQGFSSLLTYLWSQIASAEVRYWWALSSGRMLARSIVPPRLAGAACPSGGS